MSKFSEMNFSDFITLQRGYDLTREQFEDGPYPVVSSTSIMGYHKVCKVKGPGVVTGRSGTIGQVQYIESDFWPHNTSLYVKDFKGNDVKFVYYFLRFFNPARRQTGSAVPTLNRNNLSAIKISVPDIPTQRKIASILSAYDDLIEVNRKQIKLLEEAAERLYQEWFIDLRFPGYEHTTVVDGLPEGWKESRVGELYSKLESGSRPKGGIDSSITNGVPSVGAENVIGLGQYNYASEKLVTHDFFDKSKRGIIGNKDILIYKDGAYIGKTSLFQDGFPRRDAMVNEHVFLLHAKEETSQYYLFFTLHQNIYFEKMQKLNKNSAQPGINQEAIKSLGLIIPSDRVLGQFDAMVTPMISKLFALAKQNHELAEARDILLPRLMNDEIEL